MVYKKSGVLQWVDGLYGEVRLGKRCIHIIISFSPVSEETVDDTVIKEVK